MTPAARTTTRLGLPLAAAWLTLAAGWALATRIAPLDTGVTAWGPRVGLVAGVLTLVIGAFAVRSAWRARHRGGIAAAGLASLLGALMAVLSVAPLGQAPALARHHRCGSNMRAIGQVLDACLNQVEHADDRHGDPLADATLDDLVAAGAMPADLVRCPVRGRPGPGPDYKRVRFPPGYRPAAASPVLIEPLENHAGRDAHILYLDGHVDSLNADALADRIAAWQAELAKQGYRVVEMDDAWVVEPLP